MSMPTIAEALTALRNQLPAGVELVGVSKFHPVERLREAYDAGLRHFGESRAQELAAKAPLMPPDVCWHFIGHLQRNKVRTVAAVAAVVESVDSVGLLRQLGSEAVRAGRSVEVLLQVHVAAEQAKTGFDPDELLRLAAMPDGLPDVDGTEVRGIMAMATLTDDPARVRADFDRARHVFEALRHGRYARRADRFNILSMGMTDDWPLAVECGSNHVRIGSAIFGQREY